MTKVGILGAGQLGWMMARAGRSLGMQFRFLDPRPGEGAKQLGDVVTAEFDDEAALAKFCDGLDVVTYEFENVPAQALELIANKVSFDPSREALRVSQDRFVEKSYLRDLGARLPEFVKVDDAAGVDAAAKELGYPFVLKTRQFGYDGKGQVVVRSSADHAAAAEIATKQPSIAEQFVKFSRELSLLAVRGRDGECKFYPLVENLHEGGILRVSRAPAKAVGELNEQAQAVARLLLEQLQYVGVLTIEFFQVGDDLLVNEIAPRVHNSGHWTIEGATTSQFENHMRAVTGKPIGPTNLRGASAMVNVIGEFPGRDQVALGPEYFVHDYLKEPRPGRKLGHVTITSPSADGIEERLQRLTNVPGLIIS